MDQKMKICFGDNMGGPIQIIYQNKLEVVLRKIHGVGPICVKAKKKQPVEFGHLKQILNTKCDERIIQNLLKIENQGELAEIVVNVQQNLQILRNQMNEINSLKQPN